MQNLMTLRDYRKLHPEDTRKHKIISKSGDYYNFECGGIGDSIDRRTGRIVSIEGDKIVLELTTVGISNVTHEPYGPVGRTKYTASLKDFEGFIGGDMRVTHRKAPITKQGFL
jgi:hypothetical protein